jgi:hypothetical protein
MKIEKNSYSRTLQKVTRILSIISSIFADDEWMPFLRYHGNDSTKCNHDLQA